MPKKRRLWIDQVKRATIETMRVKKAFIANRVVYWLCRTTPEALTATTVQTACRACMLTLIPVTERHYVKGRWMQLGYGFEEMENGRSSIVAGSAENSARTV